MPDYYEIIIKGCLDQGWSTWFDGLSLSHLKNKEVTMLAGYIPDQAALHGILERIRDLNMELISVSNKGPNPN
ncbi:MAG: hypothetical protein CL609_01195 [Anaerolineaceae bacterium]|nr:hypothetical protein [Anaerolineaceae bacterium]